MTAITNDLRDISNTIKSRAAELVDDLGGERSIDEPRDTTYWQLVTELTDHVYHWPEHREHTEAYKRLYDELAARLDDAEGRKLLMRLDDAYGLGLALAEEAGVRAGRALALNGETGDVNSGWHRVECPTLSD